jgi:NAD(P)-dependent dehydrogenase (short-subunit alcohol dehydrogenase family)
MGGRSFSTQSFARHRRDVKEHGQVINISSVRELPSISAYCMAKGQAQ